MARHENEETGAMKATLLVCAAMACASIVGGGASAQLPSLSGGAGLLKGGGLPGVGSASMGNAAGVLSYCIKNKLLGAGGGGDASSVLGKLTGDKAVPASPDYSQGAAGLLQTGKASTFSLDSVTGGLKSKLCDMVLQRGKSLAGL
jgi:hypothetical protein